jgi:hypothetical protein
MAALEDYSLNRDLERRRLNLVSAFGWCSSFVAGRKPLIFTFVFAASGSRCFCQSDRRLSCRTFANGASHTAPAGRNSSSASLILFMGSDGYLRCGNFGEFQTDTARDACDEMRPLCRSRFPRSCFLVPTVLEQP